MENMALDRAFWRDRRVFVTGHTGFKGSWLSLWLSELGAKVYGFALPPTGERSLFSAARIAGLVDSHFGDVRTADLVQALEGFDPDMIFHLAAQSLVRPSYREPLATFDVNVMGTAYVLDAVRRLPRTVPVVAVTSDKCYENKDWVWGYRETDTLGGADPYSASKACAELVCSAYRQSYGGSIATARAGNVIGGGDWSVDRLVPDVMRALYLGSAPEVRNPSYVRTWQHVLDPIYGYLLLAERLAGNGVSNEAYASAWNFGPPPLEAMAVADVVNHLLGLWGRGAWVHSKQAGRHEARTLRIDSSKANVQLGWSPRWAVEEAIAKVVEWHRVDIHGGDVVPIMQKQIAAYEEICSVR